VKFFAIIVGGVVVWRVLRLLLTAFEKLNADAVTSAIPTSLTRWAARRKAAPPLPTHVAPELPSPAPIEPISRLVVTRPAHATVRMEFKGKAALRRAIIAQEVLGPPLSLRPPRP